MKISKQSLLDLFRFFPGKPAGKSVCFSRARLDEIRSQYIPIDARFSELRHEVDTLCRHLEEVLKHPGEYVLIQGDDIVGYYSSFSAAIGEGYKRRGLEETFMVKEVDELTRPPIRLPFGRIASLIEVDSN
jgi:hypothetical protein